MDDGIARMGEVVFSTPELTTLRALGLGSCIGLCLFDPVIKLGCLVHIMLPHARDMGTPEVGKYADTAVPHVIKEIAARGAVRMRIRAAIVGGAQLFHFDGAEERLDVGKRNIETVKALLSDMKIRLVAEDVGGKSGRTVFLDAKTGDVTVKQVGGMEKCLVNMAA